MKKLNDGKTGQLSSRKPGPVKKAEIGIFSRNRNLITFLQKSLLPVLAGLFKLLFFSKVLVEAFNLHSTSTFNFLYSLLIRLPAYLGLLVSVEYPASLLRGWQTSPITINDNM